MKTLCYEASFEQKGRFISYGYIVAQLDDSELCSLEGQFALDYLVAKIQEKSINLQYYIIDDSFKNLIRFLRIDIAKENFQLPLNVKILADNNEVFEILSLKKIEKPHEIYRICKELENFKEATVFASTWEE